MAKYIFSLALVIAAIFAGGVYFFSSSPQEGQNNGGQNAPVDFAAMPPAFDGFIDRWNRETSSHLSAIREKNLEETKNLRAQLEQAQASRAKAISKKIALKESDLAEIDRMLGDAPYIRELSPGDLPSGLIWQNGMDEPDIGDSAAVKGGNINLWNPTGFPSTLRAFGPNSKNYFNYSLYDNVDMRLVYIHPQTGRIIPGLACEWAESADRRTVFYKINPKATYSDGSPVTARDFLLNICLRTSPYAEDPYYLNLFRTNYSSIRTYGQSIIAVTLPQGKPLLPYIASQDIFPANRSFYRQFNSSFAVKYQWQAAPTTGAYTVSQQDVAKGSSITMRRVKNWWAKDLKFYKNTCNVDSITHHFISDENKAIELFRRGDIDAMTVHKPEIWNEKLEIEPVFNGYIQKTSLETEYPQPPFGFFINAAIKPLDDLNIRKGIQHAFNITLILEQVFHGDMKRLGSYTSGYGDFTDNSITPVEYSPELARQYFALAGYGIQGSDGILRNKKGQKLQIELTYADMSPMMVSVSKLLKQHALACGLLIKLDPAESSVCSQKVFEKRHQIAFWAWPLPYPLPELSQKFHSSLAYDHMGRTIPNTDNIVSLADDEMDQALSQEKQAANESEFKQATHRAQRRLHELAVWVPGWEAVYTKVAYWRWVKWPSSRETKFCYPAIYDPLESHLYWIDAQAKQETFKAMDRQKTFEEHNEIVNKPNR